MLRLQRFTLVGIPKWAFLFFVTISFAVAACADGNQTSTVRVVREKQIQVPFPPEFSIPPVVTYMQFKHLDWSATTGEIAASAAQGSWVYIVNPETGATRTIRTALRGGARPLTWLPNTRLLMAEGGLQDIYGNVQVYDTAGDLSKPVMSSLMNARAAVKGITLPDGQPAFVSLGEPKVSSVEKGIKYFAYIHAGPEWKPVQKVQVFPNDGYAYYPRHAAITQTADGIYAFIQAQFGKLGGDEGLNAWLVNLSTGKTTCRIDPSEGAANINERYSFTLRGVGISKTAHWMAANTAKTLDIFDVKNCKRLYRLNDGESSYPRGAGFVSPVFTPDEKYLILVGTDVRASKGGYLNVWRVADGQLIYHDEELRPQALTVDPNSKRFVVGHDQGQLTFFHIED